MSIEGQGHFFTIYFQVLYVLYITRPRYQVRVYRTTGPVVNWIFFILAVNKDMHESLDEFEFRQDPTPDKRVSCPWASEKSMYNVVNTIAPSFLIESSLFCRYRGEL